MPAQQLRSYVFTLNNYTESNVEALRLYAGKCKYLVFGYEKGEKGTPHLQGFCQLKKRTSFNVLKKEWPTMHIEATMGTPKEAADYCKKGGNIEEFGEMMDSVKGGDLEKERWVTVIKLAEEGKLEEIKETEPQAYLHSYKTLKQLGTEKRILSTVCDGFDFKIERPWTPNKYSCRINLPVDRQTGKSIIWLCGPALTGKTYILKNQHFDDGTIIPVYDIPDNKDFSGYKGEIILGVNEFQGCHTPTQLIKWTEQTPVNGKYLESFKLPANVIIVVTSNSTPREVFNNINEHKPAHLDAFLSRCRVIILDTPNPQCSACEEIIRLDEPIIPSDSSLGLRNAGSVAQPQQRLSQWEILTKNAIAAFEASNELERKKIDRKFVINFG